MKCCCLRLVLLHSLLQALISRAPIGSTALQMEAEKMCEIAKRMANGLVEYFQAEQFTKNSFNSVLSAAQFVKSLNTRTWYFRQFYHALNLSAEDVNKLQRHGISTVEDLLRANAREIEDVRCKFNQKLNFSCLHCFTLLLVVS